MQKKLRLKQADEYDYRVATLYAIKAVVAYMDGAAHCDRIGNEQGDIAEWDDVVLHSEHSATIHCQVKRQTTDFCTNKPVRANKSNGKNLHELQDLSALDSAFSQLGKHFSKTMEERGGEKRFRLAIPHPNIQIKKELTVVHLSEVVRECAKHGATWQTLAQAQGAAAKVREWLSSWCSFPSEAAMFDCLRALEIVDHGDEARLDDDGRALLAHWYAATDEVWRAIRDFIVANASADHSITPRMIACHIERYMRPERRAWARYHKTDALNWEVAGTLSGHGTEIEPPAQVVERLWAPSPGRSYELHFSHRANLEASDRLQFSLLRLALHVASGVQVIAVGADGWHATVAHIVRKTLGASETELAAQAWTDWTVTPMPLDRRRLRQTSVLAEESSRLEASMSALTWKEIRAHVGTRVADAEPGPLRDAVEALWIDWMDEIDGDGEHQRGLAAEMLHANSEGSLTLGALRAGPRTATLVADALVMLLHLAVGSDANDRSWRAFGADVPVRTVAMLFWAGPHQEAGRVRRFFDHDKPAERGEFLGKETARLLVLPQSTLSPSAIHGRSLAAGRDGGDGLADARTPRAIVTRSFEYEAALEQNTVESLQAFLQSVLQERQSLRAEHISALTQGATP